MKTVITYGTFDLFHTGHLNLLKRAKALGDRLIVGVTSDAYDLSRGKLNVLQSYAERIENVRLSGLADLILVEEAEGQKIQDIQKYNADIFAIGSDWIGKFDYLNEYCDVVYLERTKGVSSTELRAEKQQLIRMGIAGHGRIAARFLQESKYVSGVEITAVYGRNTERVSQFVTTHEIANGFTDYDAFLESVDAVYIALPHNLHYKYAREALKRHKHVLCEKPLVLSTAEAQELYETAEANGCILLEAVKTGFAPAFNLLEEIAKSGRIGAIKAIDATFTKLVTNTSLREYDARQAGGALTELGSYPLFCITKFLGTNPKSISFISECDSETNVDIYTRINLIYPGAAATANVGIGVKKEGDLCIAGTKGYIYVPAPWWKTEFFELRFEDSRQNRKYFIKFEEDGLRYELAAFLNMIHGGSKHKHHVSQEESIFMARVIELFRKGENVTWLGE